jgi:dTDP-glucose pyrophosphorylase
MIKKLITRPNITLSKAIKLLKISGKKCLIIINDNKQLLGTLTDGDIRQSILSGKKLNKSIKNIYNPKPKFIFKNRFNFEKVKKIILKNKIEMLPILNEKKEVINVITWDQIFNEKIKINKKLIVKSELIIMAGGKGSRLEPFTNILPKPLIPVDGKAIIEHITERFKKSGVTRFYISINYKSRMIEAYFKEANPKYKIKFIKEGKPLGTAGILYRFSGKFKHPVFITNCDIIVDTDLSEILSFHKSQKNEITLVASSKNYQIPYGVCNLDDLGNFKSISEKPKLDFLANIGLYIINPRVFNLIPKNKKLEMTKLISLLKSKNYKIGVYPISDNLWFDVGQWGEYNKTLQKFKSIK